MNSFFLIPLISNFCACMCMCIMCISSCLLVCVYFVVGDKTRMDQLSKSDDCYVRASPTRGVLGGIAEHTADVITLCEAGAVHQ
jgi:Methylmalonyl Co-A mutase-associated GTPase MeaB